VCRRNRCETCSDAKVANRNGFRVGDRSLTRPFRDARRFPSTRWYPVPGATRTTLGFGICPSFKDHSRAKPRVTIRNVFHRCKTVTPQSAAPDPSAPTPTICISLPFCLTPRQQEMAEEVAAASGDMDARAVFRAVAASLGLDLTGLPEKKARRLETHAAEALDRHDGARFMHYMARASAACKQTATVSAPLIQVRARPCHASGHPRVEQRMQRHRLKRWSAPRALPHGLACG
jgi:hypothetical protein